MSAAMGGLKPVVTGVGHVLALPCDPTPYLKVRKSRKFMGGQDELAVTAAGLALRSAGLAGAPLGERAGLYLAVGRIPFEEPDIDAILGGAVVDGAFSMRRFSEEGYHAGDPLLTFRCLCNMPAFHISVNFDVRGPYLVTYPGPGQFYIALEAARAALEDGLADLALVGAVAHQRNFLVEHHFSRVAAPVSRENLVDAAACLVLETEARAAGRGAAVQRRLVSLSVSYRPHDPFEESLSPSEAFEGVDPPSGELGPCSLPVALGFADGRPVVHRLLSRDGILAESRWGAP